MDPMGTFEFSKFQIRNVSFEVNPTTTTMMTPTSGDGVFDDMSLTSRGCCIWRNPSRLWRGLGDMNEIYLKLHQVHVVHVEKTIYKPYMMFVFLPALHQQITHLDS